ncbi:MAG: response regulator [Spirochaetia bacterium]|nr:response regulator [Spirochaetia bacterium]
MKLILIVEDKAIIALTYKRAIQKYYTTNLVTTDLAAIDAVKTFHPDLILMDIMLEGEMDGIEAARQIQL